MSHVAEKLKISVEDYLQGELISDIKHEYVNGEVYAMAGAKRWHNMISMNLSIILGSHLRSTPCHLYNSDMKVGILTKSDDCFYYPDLHVSCEQTNNDLYNVEPKLIIEVLSDSTERKDRTEKFRDYRQLKSLQEYVLVAQEEQRVEIYRRNQNFDLALLTDEASFTLESIDLSLTLADVYQDINF